jgi:hypothetical protein
MWKAAMPRLARCFALGGKRRDSRERSCGRSRASACLRSMSTRLDAASLAPFTATPYAWRSGCHATLTTGGGELIGDDRDE